MNVSIERVISKEIQAALALRESLKALHVNDAEAIADAVEGETSLLETIAAVDRSIIDDEAMVAGLTTTIAELESRKSRVQIRIERKRAAVEQALQIAERQTIELPTGTLTLKNVPPKLEIIDESKIPARFWKTADPTIDRTALTAAFKASVTEQVSARKAGLEPPAALEIPGARLGNGGITLQIRRS